MGNGWKEMESQEYDGFYGESTTTQAPPVTHERDDQDSDKGSSCESYSNNPLLISKITNHNSKTKTVSRMSKRNISGSVIAEEKRRKKIIRLKFMELSSIVPGMNKTDEDSMLDDAINYMKQLQERANILEGQKMKKNVVVEKAWVSGNNDIATSSSNFPESCYQSKQALPEIEIKAQGRNLLIRVHCENQNGYITKVVGEMERFHLDVENISALPFGNYYQDITVFAQMDDDFCMSMKDLKRKLRDSVLQFM